MDWANGYINVISVNSIWALYRSVHNVHLKWWTLWTTDCVLHGL